VTDARADDDDDDDDVGKERGSTRRRQAELTGDAAQAILKRLHRITADARQSAQSYGPDRMVRATLIFSERLVAKLI